MYVYLLSKRITLIYCANFLTCNICCKYLQHTYSSLAAPNGSVKCVISLALYLSIFIFKIAPRIIYPVCSGILLQLLPHMVYVTFIHLISFY